MSTLRLHFQMPPVLATLGKQRCNWQLENYLITNRSSSNSQAGINWVTMTAAMPALPVVNTEDPGAPALIAQVRTIGVTSNTANIRPYHL